jgi:hypothetical protein
MPSLPRRALFGAFLLIAPAALAACYRTVPLESEPPPENQEVVLDFTATGAERLGGLLGPAIASARGRSVSWGTDSIRISMIATTTTRGDEQFWHGETVSIPREAIARFHERRFDRGRTALAVAASVAAAVAVQQIAGANRGRLPPKGPGTPGQQ